MNTVEGLSEAYGVGLIKKRNEIKIFILYMLNTIDYAIDHNTLHDLCVQDNFVSSFDFMDCIVDLCESGCIHTFKDGTDDKYEITDTGKKALAPLENDLLTLVRDRALHSAIRLLSFEKSGGKVHVAIEKLEFGYNVSCEIVKHGNPVMSVSLNVSSKSLADRIEANVRERPEEVYKGISSILLDDIALL